MGWIKAMCGFFILVLGIGIPSPGHAATGCSLNNPEEDLFYFFKKFSDFTIRYTTFAHQNPEGHRILAQKLGGTLDPVYETKSVPYTMYTVFNDGELVGFVFGANQRGKYSNIQIVAGTDEAGNLKKVHLQKIRSPRSADFRSEKFLDALGRIPFSTYPEWSDCYLRGECSEVLVPDPTGGVEKEDYKAILKGLSKLFYVRKLLLKPGSSVLPSSPEARAEHVSLHWVPEQGFRPLLDPPKKSLSEATTAEIDDSESVAVVSSHDDVIIYPLSLLTLHPVIEDTLDGQRISVTWSSSSYTLSVLRITPAAPWKFSNSNSLIFGHQTLIERESLKDWCAISGVPWGDSNDSVRLDYHETAWTMPWSVAKQYFPAGRLAYSADSFSKHREFYAAHQRRFHRPRKHDRVLVIGTGDTQRVVSRSSLGEGGLFTLGTAKAPILLLAHSDWHAAFQVPEGITSTDIQWTGNDRSKGFPLFHSASLGVTWSALDGRPVSGKSRAGALVPVLLREMPRHTAKAFFPESKVGVSWQEPQRLGSPAKFETPPSRSPSP